MGGEKRTRGNGAIFSVFLRTSFIDDPISQVTLEHLHRYSGSNIDEPIQKTERKRTRRNTKIITHRS